MADFGESQNGGEAESEAFVTAHAESIVRYCYGILCNCSDADDAA